jgi:hypothetical protein
MERVIFSIRPNLLLSTFTRGIIHLGMTMKKQQKHFDVSLNSMLYISMVSFNDGGKNLARKTQEQLIIIYFVTITKQKQARSERSNEYSLPQQGSTRTHK